VLARSSNTDLLSRVEILDNPTSLLNETHKFINQHEQFVSQAACVYPDGYTNARKDNITCMCRSGGAGISNVEVIQVQ
jgi:hypothetical protein